MQMDIPVPTPQVPSDNAKQIINKRYSVKNKDGKPTEDWNEIARRVAHHAAEAETDAMEKATFFNNAYDLIKRRIFLPNTPCLVNAGRQNAQLAGCYVLPVADSIKGIMKTASDAAVIHQSGGGTGFTFEHLRPAGSIVNTTHGVASGPISFMEIFDKVTDVVKQGGVRRGANMGILRCLAKGTLISTLEGKVPIEKLVGTRPYLYCTDGNKVKIRQAEQVFKTGIRELVRVWFDDDSYLDCTPDHSVMMADKTYKEAGKLSLGDSVAILNKRLTNGYLRLGITGTSGSVAEHIAVYEMKYGEYPTCKGADRQPEDTIAHHDDENKLNNHPNNILKVTLSEHGRIHSTGVLEENRIRISQERKGKTWEEYYGKEKAVALKTHKSKTMQGTTPWNLGLAGEEYKEHYESGFSNQSATNVNHKVIRVQFLDWQDEVYDISMPDFHNFVANGVFVHNCDHPDILRFIHAKNNQDKLTNFNVSVAVTDEFMAAVENGEWYQTKFNGVDWKEPVFDPSSESGYLHRQSGMLFQSAGMLYAPDVWNRIITSAHKWAEPGIIFIDTVNKTELLKSLGPIESCNPCGEQFLHSYNSCNLGSIDVSKFYCPDWNGSEKSRGYQTPGGGFHWENFREAVYWSVRFLDNVIDTCDWPLPEIDNIVKRTRPIGLGIMGFADLLLKLKIRYGSEESLNFLSVLMSNFRQDAWCASLQIGREKGAFPEYENNKETYDRFFWHDLNFDDFLLDNFGEMELGNAGHFHPRNYEVTTVAPTGTISLVAECSSGIEPNFAWSFHRTDTVGERDYYHPLALQVLGVDPDDHNWSINQQLLGNSVLPDYFVTAHEVTPEEHVKVLATAQKYVDNGVSKTVNGPENDTVENVDRLYRLAYKLGVKAISYYRDGSRNGQVLTHKAVETKKLCGDCKEPLQEFDGCNTCVSCGAGSCTLG